MNNLITLLILSLLPIFSSCQNNSDYLKNKDYKITRSNQEWREILTPLEYHVLRNAGTEKPYTGLYDKHYKKEFIPAKVVTKNYINQKINITAIADGHLLIMP